MTDYGDLSIKVEDITSNVVTNEGNEVTGSGVFDTLMNAVNKHIKAQYEEGRIYDSEFSTVYVNALQSTLELSARIVLDQKLKEKQAEEVAARTVLLEQQKLTEIENTRISVNNADKLKYELDFLYPAQKTLTENQASKVASDQTIAETQSSKDALIKDEQKSKLAYEVNSLLPKQMALLTQQELTETQKTSLVDAQKVGFEVDFRLKHAKLLWDSWSVGFSVAQDALGTGDTDTLTLLNKTNVQNAMTNLGDAINRFPSAV